MDSDRAQNVLSTLQSVACAFVAASAILLGVGLSATAAHSASNSDVAVYLPLPTLGSDRMFAFFADVSRAPREDNPGFLVAHLGYQELHRQINGWRQTGRGSITLHLPDPSAMSEWISFGDISDGGGLFR
jgi:hypothetical protein